MADVDAVHFVKQGYALPSGQAGLSSHLRQAQERYEGEEKQGAETVSNQLQRFTLLLGHAQEQLAALRNLRDELEATAALIHGAVSPINSARVSSPVRDSVPEPSSLIGKLSVRTDELNVILAETANVHETIRHHLGSLRSSL